MFAWQRTVRTEDRTQVLGHKAQKDSERKRKRETLTSHTVLVVGEYVQCLSQGDDESYEEAILHGGTCRRCSCLAGFGGCVFVSHKLFEPSNNSKSGLVPKGSLQVQPYNPFHERSCCRFEGQ